jgi:hypothetical protein
VPDLSHLWQRFLLASTLVFGLALGIGATVFAYSNTAPVNLGWSIFHLNSVPLWTVVLVPIALILLVGTLFHWFNSLHHFTEHMRHRRRVHDLEVELASVRKHLDEMLQMPGQSAEPAIEPEPAPPATVATASSNGEAKTEPEAVAGASESDGAVETESAVPSEA